MIQVACAQQATVIGTLKDEQGKPIEGVTIIIKNTLKGTISNERGNYKLSIPADKDVTIVFSHIQFETQRKVVRASAGSKYLLNFSFKEGRTVLPIFIVEDKKTRQKVSMFRVDPKIVEYIPTVSGGIEGLIKTLPGVSSNNELSSQYSVRGGNYDENLIYVNDFEIYRPFLIRSGQQEGLSFINPNLVSSISFSAGGFEARYGDKMSSVLDIKYKKPRGFGGSVSASLLGSAMHLEGDNENHRFTYLFGARYKSNQYILNSLQTKGQYKPSFIDIQTYMTYDLTTEFELGFLGYYSRNKYLVEPDSVVTRFGNVLDVVELAIFFDGQEVDEYETAMGGLSLNYTPNKNLSLKWLASAYLTKEDETFDIIGDYFLYAVETDLGKDDFGQRAFSLGWGTSHDWARNYLDAMVLNTELKGGYSSNNKNHYLQWGAKYQYEDINDEINEWLRVDSVGFSLPYSDSIVLISEVLKTNIGLSSSRVTAYIQDDWIITQDDTTKEITLTAGVRAHYWNFNNELLISPRVQFSFRPLSWRKNKPNKEGIHEKRDVIFKGAAGFYYQPPFYREFRDRDGIINNNIRSQRSIHAVLGADWNFKMWKRPFKFTAEAYYKQLNNLIPYDLDNVLIRYHAKNNAKGYAAGIDFRINGEFVPGAESWASLSFLRTEENLDDDYNIVSGDTVSKGFIPRPTDQLVNFGMFFQDYLPGNKNFKVHLNFLFGSSLPFGPPEAIQARNAFRAPPYRRIDIGFSALLVSKDKELPPKSPFRHFESIWITAEIFNLLQIDNTVSYLWVKDLNNAVYAVPQNLTTRRINIRLITKF